METSNIRIAVFTNNSDNPKAPSESVVVTFPDGTKLEGGLWSQTSSKGTTYKSGTLRKAQERGQYEGRAPSKPRQAPGRAALPSDPVDW